MKLGVVKETFPGESRVALIPQHLSTLTKAGLEIVVESGAGTAAGFPDAAYEDKGARLASRDGVYAECDAIVQVRCLGANPDAGRADLSLTRRGQILVGFVEALGSPEASRELAGTGASTFALELVPRITRAQAMDILSSMATIAGYKGVLLAADRLPRMFPMMMTAAGTITPAKVFIIGVGVAGLQAIASARRLGAVVHAYDIRPAVKEQVESLGGKFVELAIEAGESEDKGGYAKAMGEEFYRKQRELMTEVIAQSDVVITTAAVPGKKPPTLVTADMVRAMGPGSVIVDLAAERGGNCELTRPGEDVVENGVLILGPTNLPTTVPYHASQMLSKNVVNFLVNMMDEGKLNPQKDDEIVRETLVTHGGEVVHPRVLEALGMAPAPAGE